MPVAEIFALGARAFKSFGKNRNSKELLTELTQVIKPKGAMPSWLEAIKKSKSGIYKLDSRERIIDTLLEVKDASGKAKFSEKAVRKEIKKISSFNKILPDGPIFTLKQYASKQEVTIGDVRRLAAFSSDNALSCTLTLNSEELKAFRKFIKYKTDNGPLTLDFGNPSKFSILELMQISRMPKEKQEIIERFVNLQRKDFRGQMFSAADLIKLAEMKTNLKPAEIKKMAKTLDSSGCSLVEAAQVEGLNVRKFVDEVSRIRKGTGNKTYFNIEHDIYDKNKFRMMQWSPQSEKEVLVKTYDNNMNLISTDKIVPGAARDQIRIIGKDFDMTTRVVKETCGEGAIGTSKSFEVLSETRRISDKNGNLIRTEILEQSGVKGSHNWTAIYPDGRKESIIKAGLQDGNILIEKNMPSLDGKVTKSFYKKAPDGNWEMNLNILDENGKVLSKRNLNHKMVSADEAISVVNGKQYNIKYSKNEIRMTDLETKSERVINLNELIDSSMKPEEADKIRKLLKECSADELDKIIKKVKNIKFNPDYKKSCASGGAGSITTIDDIFVFRHELTHVDDLCRNSLDDGIFSSAADVVKSYQKEMNLFLKEFPQTQRKHIEYFIDPTEKSIIEAAAELGASNHGPDLHKLFSTRTEYVERYFPEMRSLMVNS